MKTSNKILLGVLLVSFGLLASVQIALYVKYTNKDFTSAAKYNAFFRNYYALANIKHVRINSLAQCLVVFADSANLSIEKSNIHYVNFNVNGDTLILSAEHTNDTSYGYKLNMSPQNVTLYIPAGIDVRAYNSNIELKGSSNQAKNVSCNLDITNCSLYTRRGWYIDSLNRYFDTLTITARKKSEICLFHNDNFKAISVELDHSLINDYSAKIAALTVMPDTNSTVIISGQNLNKLNATAIRK